MSVAVVSCIYGEGYDDFVPSWSVAVRALDPAPDEVIVASDRERHIEGARVVVADCPWRHPQAFYLKEAIGYVGSDWAWIVDMDDRALPDGLAGLDEVFEDVWQMGFLRSDGEEYCPPPMPGPEFLASSRNVFTAGSAIRATAFWRAGGMRDVAFQDWALWRSLARAGCSFRSSGRAHYRYERHDGTRSALELTPSRRSAHLYQMLELEHA